MKKLLLLCLFMPSICFPFDKNDEKFKINNSLQIEKLVSVLEDKHGILDRQELISLINELKIKSCLLNERIKNSQGKDIEYLPCDEIDEIKESPYSASNNMKLMFFSSHAMSICFIGGNDDMFTDVKFIHNKILTHSKNVSALQDMLLNDLLTNNKIVKK